MLNRKIVKLFSNPNLFFYDMFRKRVIKNTPLYIADGHEKKTIKNAQKVVEHTIGIDIFEIQKNGVLSYLKNNLKCGVSPEDGIDANSILIWSGYLNGLLCFLRDMKKAMSMNVTIYTMGGGFNHTSKVSEILDIRMLESKLTSRPDFVVEMNNELGDLYVLHFYLYDINSEGLVQVRSSKALIKKCLVNEVPEIFNGDMNTKIKIDAVYTWVNHADEKWQEKWVKTFSDEGFDPDRYTSNDELRYSLRSINKYAPWLNHIYIVSNCERPKWLELNDKITWVDHSKIFPADDMLPSFSSHAIECCLHNIEGLEENFIYLNDDFILAQPCLPSDFFDEVGRSISYFESYGMVFENTVRGDIPDYLQASINSCKLLKEKYPCYNARNLHRHVPYALKKSVLKNIEDEFTNAINETRYAKRRSENDVNLTSFFYHHYAFINGHSVKSDLNGIIVRPENIKNIIGKDRYKYKILCFNDGNGSAENNSYKNDTQAFFNERLSEKANWEIN
ncbi:stealth conserved region 3 domain-containing protein [Escherichia coli]|nr:sugar phosphotransferase [Escherichia coli]ELU9779302.1 stealth conserved region 3 domain-containing protein [Escherichia coli]HAN8087019.1 sugar phosphotransferase [Escherichia coli]